METNHMYGTVSPLFRAFARMINDVPSGHSFKVNHDSGQHTNHSLPEHGRHGPEEPPEPLTSELKWVTYISMKEPYIGTRQNTFFWNVRNGSYVRSSAEVLNRDPDGRPNIGSGNIVDDIINQAWFVRNSEDVNITLDYEIGNGILALINLFNPVTFRSFVSPINWTRIRSQEWLDDNSRGLGYFYDDNIPPSVSTTEEKGRQVQLPGAGAFILVGAIRPRPAGIWGPDSQLTVRCITPSTVFYNGVLDQEPTLISQGSLAPGSYSGEILGVPFTEPGPQFGGNVVQNSGTITLELTGAVRNISVTDFSAVRGSDGQVSVKFNGIVPTIPGRSTFVLTLPIQYEPMDPAVIK